MSYQCYFNFNSAYHNTSIILDCINPYSSGMFCTVSKEPIGGQTATQNGAAYSLSITLGSGKTEKVNITTADETRQSCILGASNGIVLGRSSLNEGALYAFDRQCPNCLEESSYKALQFENNGLWMKCPQCKRSYDLNNSGYVVGGEPGKKLLRYRASYGGNMLMVRN